jgi:AAA domain-containing protein/MarR family protein
MNPPATHDDARCLPVIQVGQIPLEPQPRRWLVEGLWGASAVGFIGGPPKSCKSYLGLELAVAVATGTPALSTYPVLEPGPALVYLAEDALPAVRERTSGLARHRAVELRHLALHVITAPRLRLDQAADCARLFETARRLRPRLLLLDPLVRLHAIDENRAPEVAQLLSGLRELQRRLDVAVVLVHHTRKNISVDAQSGQGLRGSTDLHAFGDSNLYLRRVHGGLVLSMEHRAAAAPDPVGLRLVTTDQEAVHLEVTRQSIREDQPQNRDDGLAGTVLDALAEGPAMTRQALRERLAVKNQTLGRTLQRLERLGQVERARDGWRVRDVRGVPVPVP